MASSGKKVPPEVTAPAVTTTDAAVVTETNCMAIFPTDCRIWLPRGFFFAVFSRFSF